MIYPTISKVAGFGILFLGITLSAYALMAETAKNTPSAQNIETTSPHVKAETAPETTSETDTPVIKLASLSIMTDYPAAQDSDLQLGNNAMSAEQRIAQAKALASEEKFDEALRLLGTTPANDENAYQLNYLRAQILSWSGKHEKANHAFTELRQQYPQDADIAVSFGYLHLYQNNFKDAEQLFSQVLDRFPDYHDAKQGLKRATAIQ